MGQDRESADIGRRKPERAVRIGGLGEAFDRYRTPTANRDLIRRIHETVGAARLVGYSDHFRIERRGGGPALEVHLGYTNGFRSEQDAMKAVGETPRWPSRRFHGSWGVDHPENAPAPSPQRKRSSPVRRPTAPERPAAFCPTCFLELPASGVCVTCDG